MVYLKHKQEREKQENVDANPDAVTQNDANSMSAAETGLFTKCFIQLYP